MIIMSNVYLCIHDFNLIRDLIALENDRSDLHIVGITTTIHEDIEKLIDMKVDVLVLQFTADYMLCARVISRIVANEQLRDMQILAMFKELDTDIIHLLLQYDINNFIMEPFTVEQLINAIHQEGSKKEIEDVSKWNMDSIATKTMHDLGLPLHLNGFRYIKTCSLLVAQSYPGRKLTIGNVYLECAKFHETTATRVEKSIRTAINYAYRTQPENICIYNDKPTNSQIILYISEKLKLFTVV